MQSFTRRIVLTLAILILPTAIRADELYFVVVFGSQRPVINNADYTHSFAVFVRATGCGSDFGTYALEPVVISWLPRDLEIDAHQLKPEPGVNLPLRETLDLAISTKQRVSQWGPYQIRPELYAAAVRRVAHFESGTIAYRASDILKVRDDVSNCIYAVLEILGDNDSLGLTSFGFGERASWLISRRLRPWMIDPKAEHHWLDERLGLADYPIIHRQGPPRLSDLSRGLR